MNETSELGSLLCVGAVVLGILAVIARLIYEVCKTPRKIACPECDGGTRRPLGPCPVCGPEDQINVGSNPVPRGYGVSGSPAEGMPSRAARNIDWWGRRRS